MSSLIPTDIYYRESLLFLKIACFIFKHKEKIGDAKSKQTLTQSMSHLLCQIPVKTLNTSDCIILHVTCNACFQNHKQVTRQSY